jgi:predicted lipid-binding transport protein (Tim44 family)
MLGGLAAGLGLAWLANALGLGPAFANLLLIGLLAMIVMVVFGMLRRGRAPMPDGLAYQGAGAANPVTPPQYNPTKVGNDASARPWESAPAQFNAGGGSIIGSALGGSQGWGIPADFDVAGFTDAAKRNFITLQAAWDRSDIPALRAMMTDGMLAEIQTQLAERERAAAPGEVNQTEVVMLEAQLLGIEELEDAYMASVEFNGLIREDPSSGPSPFREVWNMTKPRGGRGGWLVAGVQALQ